VVESRLQARVVELADGSEQNVGLLEKRKDLQCIHLSFTEKHLSPRFRMQLDTKYAAYCKTLNCAGECVKMLLNPPTRDRVFKKNKNK